MKKIAFFIVLMMLLFGLSGCDKEEVEVKSLFERYMELDIDRELLNLEKQEDYPEYYCYPVHKTAIGFEGFILYCFIDGYEEMVFAVNPENYDDDGQIYPLAKNFEEFLQLVVACGSVNPAEQIHWMSQEKFEESVESVWEYRSEERKVAIDTIQKELGIMPMENPYAYVKEVQKEFDDSKIVYSDAYYESQGIYRDGTPVERTGEGWTLTFEFPAEAFEKKGDLDE
ncbi:LptM family lipoprotein [Anaerotignum sp.]